MSGPSSSALAWRSGETVRAAVIALALNLVFLSPIFQHPRNWGIEDWDQHAFYHEAARISILDYGQWPQWNPWYCGGTDLLANPQSRVFDPAYPLVLALGSIVGLKIELALYAWLGLLGMYVLGRDLGLDPVSAWLAPIVYFCGPTYALPASSGMTWIMSTAYIPWVVLLFLRGPGARRAAVACGACLALMYLGGGVYPVVVTATFLGFLAIASLRAWGVAAVTRLTVAVLACSLILGAAKILPSVAFMREFPRRMDQQSGFSVQSLAFGLFHRDQSLSMAQAGFDGDHFDRSDRLLRGISTDFDDVGMYIGPLVAALAVVGLASRGRRLWPFAASIPVFVWLSFGDRPRASLFGALHTLPVFESMRYAERYRFAWLLAVCMFAGHGVRWLSCRLQRAYPGRRLGAGVATLVLAIVACDLYAITRPIYRAAFPIPPLAVRKAAAFAEIAGLDGYDARGFRRGAELETYGAWSSHYPALLMNVGAVNCYETAFVPRRATPSTSPFYRGEVYLEDGDGSASTAEWTPNRLRYTIDVKEPRRLIVNQNYHSGWAAADGRPVENRDGLISVMVGPGDRSVELRYGRKAFTVGAVVSALGWAALMVVLLVARR